MCEWIVSDLEEASLLILSHAVFENASKLRASCDAIIDSEEAREHNGRTLCEDCYMDFLSPARAWVPWTVYTARSTIESGGSGATLTATQE